MAKKSYLAAVIQGKCPRCHEGDIFTHPVSKLGRFNVMNATCPHCGVRLEPEPGFYQGAMYVSYGFTVGILVVLSMVFYIFIPGRSEWFYIGIFITIMVLFIPFNYRYSRILYLYWFGGLKN